MSLSISNIIYTYPTPPDFTGGEQPVSIKKLKEWFDTYFSNSTSRFLTIRDNLLNDLNETFGTHIELSGSNKYDHIKISNFVSQYADDCIEAVNAYKFYGNQIVNQINKLTDYIKQANELLNNWNNLNLNNLSDQAVSDLIHTDVVKLECLLNYSLEIEEVFSIRYVYDYDEDNWKLVEDNYKQNELSNFQVKDKRDYQNDLDELRSTLVKCDKHGDEKTKSIECFNELNLLDRLKYIKVYYDITGGKTDYVFPNNPTYGFPCVKDEDKTKYIANIEKFYIGYLIDRDGPVNAFAGFFEMKVKAIEATIGLKQEELRAYNAYLNFINLGFDMLNSSQSDGKNRIPDSAIIAMTYLCGQKMYKLFTDDSGKEFLVLPSVEDATKFFLIPNDKSGMQFLLGDNGTAENYRGNCSVCLSKATNGLWQAKEYYSTTNQSFQDSPTFTETDLAFEDYDGTSIVYKGKFCSYTWKETYEKQNNGSPNKKYITAEQNPQNYYATNDSGYTTKIIEYDLEVNGIIWKRYDEQPRLNLGEDIKNNIEDNTSYTINRLAKDPYYERSYFFGEKYNISGAFSLPDELDITTINPKSVYKYSSANKRDGWTEETTGHIGWEAVIESWTNAFQTKLTYLDTAIKTTQTDIQTLHDTINTYESLTKTLRSRTHDACLNIVNKLIS